MTSANEKPWKPRNWAIINASSSEVRSSPVAMRQWSASSLLLNRPTTVCVFPTSMASSIRPLLLDDDVEADVECAHGVCERTDGDVVGAGVGVHADGLERDPTGDLDACDAVEQRDRLPHVVGLHVVEQHDVGLGFA